MLRRDCECPNSALASLIVVAAPAIATKIRYCDKIVTERATAKLPQWYAATDNDWATPIADCTAAACPMLPAANCKDPDVAAGPLTVAALPHLETLSL